MIRKLNGQVMGGAQVHLLRNSTFKLMMQAMDKFTSKVFGMERPMEYGWIEISAIKQLEQREVELLLSVVMTVNLRLTYHPFQAAAQDV